MSNIRTVKSFSQENREIQRYSDKMQKVLEIAKKEAWARGIFYGMVRIPVKLFFCLLEILIDVVAIIRQGSVAM